MSAGEMSDLEFMSCLKVDLPKRKLANATVKLASFKQLAEHFWALKQSHLAVGAS